MPFGHRTSMKTLLIIVLIVLVVLVALGYLRGRNRP
jgi:hypothetical protein